MKLPEPRGPLSGALIDTLRGRSPLLLSQPTPPSHLADALTDEDLQLALWVGFELHYRGFDDVPDDWEWQPEVIAFRRRLEDVLLAALRSEVAVPENGGSVPEQLNTLVSNDDGPSLSRYMQSLASRAEYDEFVIHRSIYQLKEADPHSWAIPRLAGRAKAALVEIQADEYGNGVVENMHSELYRRLLRGLELDDTYGAYLEDAPAITLALSNVMSLFGLRRELRGALVGHLAAYEMTSSAPCRRYARGLRRLNVDDAVCKFYDVHITADALHEQLAAYDLCGGLVEAEPDLADDVLFGAAACLYVDNRFAEYVLACWAEKHTSLRRGDSPGARHAGAVVATLSSRAVDGLRDTDTLSQARDSIKGTRPAPRGRRPAHTRGPNTDGTRPAVVAVIRSDRRDAPR
jgi:hypothetical protein